MSLTALLFVYPALGLLHNSTAYVTARATLDRCMCHAFFCGGCGRGGGHLCVQPCAHLGLFSTFTFLHARLFRSKQQTDATANKANAPESQFLANILGRYDRVIAHGYRYGNITAKATRLQRWEDAVAKNDPCPHNAWHNMTSGNWYITDGGELFFEPYECSLRRLTASEARQCLSNKTLTFVGDSISRYQYLSLAHFLVHGRFIQRYSDDNGTSLTNEHTWPSWPEFYSKGSQQLHVNSSTVTSTESCDCYRVPNEPIREFRTLIIHSGHAQRIRIEYQQAFGQDGAKTSLVEDTLRGMRESIANNTDVQMHYIMANMGAWVQVGQFEPSNLTLFMSIHQQVFNAPNILLHRSQQRLQLIWKTTTHRDDEASYAQSGRGWMYSLDGLARFWRWHILDAFSMTQRMSNLGIASMWDRLHFEPFVYDQLNDVLLNGIC